MAEAPSCRDTGHRLELWHHCSIRPPSAEQIYLTSSYPDGLYRGCHDHARRVSACTGILIGMLATGFLRVVLKFYRSGFLVSTLLAWCSSYEELTFQDAQRRQCTR